MNPETTDWKLEAKRVQRAFGITQECEFQLLFESYELRLADGTYPVSPDGGIAEIAYHIDPSGFTGWEFYLNREGENLAWISIGQNGQPESTSYVLPAETEIIRALFELGLLTPEVEAALEVRVSAHQKLEWALEYEAKISPETRPHNS